VVALPICSGRVGETVPLGSRHRRDLAWTMVSLSRGWVVRNFSAIRAEELVGVLGGRPAPATHVVTVGPVGLWQTTESAPQGALREFTHLISRLIVHYDTLLEELALDAAPGQEAAASWSLQMQERASQIAATRAGKERERALWTALVQDLSVELTQVTRQHPQLIPTSLDDLLDRFRAHISGAPLLSWYWGLLSGRLRNRSDQWEGNDLVDMTSLTAATAYCDAVVAERKTANLLNGCRRGRSGAVVVRRMADLASALDAAGIP
jgi:hypothetical protein